MKLTQIGELTSLIGLIIGEAAGEPLEGKLAVGFVARNRLYDKRWPNTWKGVIFQKLQFSCMNVVPRNGDIPKWIQANLFPMNTYNLLWWRECKYAAWGVMHGWTRDFTGGVNHYLNPKLLKKLPEWAMNKEPIMVIDNHQFYKL